MVTINELGKMVIEIAGKNLAIRNIAGPTGVRGRNSDNNLIREKLGWSPTQPLHKGISETYKWVSQQCELRIAACFASG